MLQKSQYCISGSSDFGSKALSLIELHHNCNRVAIYATDFILPVCHVTYCYGTVNYDTGSGGTYNNYQV